MGVFPRPRAIARVSCSATAKLFLVRVQLVTPTSRADEGSSLSCEGWSLLARPSLSRMPGIGRSWWRWSPRGARVPEGDGQCRAWAGTCLGARDAPHWDCTLHLTAGLEGVTSPDDSGRAAPEAAGVIHTDLPGRGFTGTVVSFDDLVAAGSMQNAKAKAAVRLEGKDHADGRRRRSPGLQQSTEGHAVGPMPSRSAARV